MNFVRIRIKWNSSTYSLPTSRGFYRVILRQLIVIIVCHIILYDGSEWPDDVSKIHTVPRATRVFKTRRRRRRRHNTARTLARSDGRGPRPPVAALQLADARRGGSGRSTPVSSRPATGRRHRSSLAHTDAEPDRAHHQS